MDVRTLPVAETVPMWHGFGRKQRKVFLEQQSEGRFRALTAKHLDSITQFGRVSEDELFEMRVVSTVLPFRANPYVIDHLIDWDRIPDDPVYQLVFPQREMLAEEDFQLVANLMKRDAPIEKIRSAANEIRARLNPHPAGQMELNIPGSNEDVFAGIQHKYRETVLFFPSQGQTCHAYCNFCFRWAQFVGDKQLKMSSQDDEGLHRYLKAHREVSDLLITGGDPMIMKTRVLARYLKPLIEERGLEHIQNIRIGTKSLTFWPQRFVTDRDADGLLKLLEKVVKSGRNVALMAHFNHWQEMRTSIVRKAIRRIRETGTVIRSQAPLLAHINNDPKVWARMWREQVKLGIVPYYMFVERDTGAKNYFEVPLARCAEVFRQAVCQVSGLGRTVRGPSMSATPGKVEVLGVQEVAGERVFVLRFLQGRDPNWVGRPFFAKFDPEATWLDGLRPAFGENRFFFEKEAEQRTGRQTKPVH